jgi:hypothetical protein
MRIPEHKTDQHQQRPGQPRTKMTDDEVAISMVGFIVLFLFFVLALLYGGPLLDWLDSL